MFQVVRQFRLVATAVVALLWAMDGSAGAGPLRNHPVTLTQPDGVVIRCFVSGDEYFNWIHDAAGFTIIADPVTGYYTYAVLDDGVPRASPYVVGQADPAVLGLRPYALPWPDKVPQMRELFPRGSAEAHDEPLAAPKTGTINNLVVFIRFAGESDFPAPPTVYNGAFNSAEAGTNSMGNYFREASYSQLSINSTFYPTQNQS
jgi:hypothetical protein